MTTLPTQSNTDNPTRWGYQARLDDYLLRFSVSKQEPYSIARGVSQTDTISTEVNPEDFTDNFGRVFSQVDFTGGAGLKYAHRRENPQNYATFFYDSFGVKVKPNGNIALADATSEIDTASLTTPGRAAYDGTYVYWSQDSPDLVRAADLLAAAPTLSTEVTGLTNDVDDVVSLGGTLYACDGTEIRDDAGGWAQWSDINAVRMWTIKGRLIVSTGDSLYESPSGTGPHTASQLGTTLAGSGEWLDVVDADSFILAAASDGYVYAFTFDGTDFALTATSTFARETPCAIGALHGRVLVTTYQEDDAGTYTGRLWVGSVSDTGTLEGMQVVKEWEGLATSGPCVLDAVERDKVYTAATDADGSTYLWAYDIQFGSIMRDRKLSGVVGDVTTILKAEGRFWMTTAQGDVYRDTGSLVSEGVVVFPLVDFFTSEKKVWDVFSATGVFDVTNAAIEVDVSKSKASIDSPNTDSQWTPLKTLTGDTTNALPLTKSPSQYISLRMKLTSGAELSGYSVRALPPPSDEVITFSVNVSDTLSRPGKSPIHLKGYGDEVWARVRDLQGEPIELELYGLGIVWRGVLVDVETPVSTAEPRGSVTRTMKVVFRGAERVNLSFNTATFGGSLWGLSLWGGVATIDEEPA